MGWNCTALFFLTAALFLAGCRPVVHAPAAGKNTTPEPYRPAPPAQVSATPNLTPVEITQSQATPTCLDNLSFVSDVSIPDQTEVTAKSTLDKRWEVKNSGNCNWNDHYRLRLIAGPGMNAVQEQALIPARSGSNAVIRILFQAPEQPGSYRSAWQAYNPDGQPFGDPVFIDIVVK